MPVERKCFCDPDVQPFPAKCDWELGDPEDCIFAEKLMRENKTVDDCPHWGGKKKPSYEELERQVIKLQEFRDFVERSFLNHGGLTHDGLDAYIREERSQSGDVISSGKRGGR